MLKRTILAACAGVAMSLAGGTASATNFTDDVSLAIDKGLGWFNSQNCYVAPFNCDDATGLALLALLEKRPAGNPNAAPLGYAGASDADKARMRRTVRHIIDSVQSQGAGFYSYRDGAYLMALSVYMLSGGPDKDDGPTTELDGAPLTLKQTVDKVFDRTEANQRKNFADSGAPYPENNGYWCYTNNGCRDSSTTQLIMSGISSLRRVYQSSGSYGDATRLAALSVVAAAAGKAYARNGTAGGGGLAAQPGEKGHGYNAGSGNSAQQTASGLWIQLVAGKDVNDADVQAYLKWIYNRFRYGDISGITDDGWGASYWYYLWSSFKAFEYLQGSPVAPTGTNLGADDIGTLASASAPVFASRQVHRDPATVVPNQALRPGGAAGAYSGEAKSIYFDYASQIIGHQCAGGDFTCNSAPGRWDFYAENAYALLVLQRSVGGGCVDVAPPIGECDPVGNQDTTPPPAPTPVTGTASSSTSATVSWSPSVATDLAGYYLYINGVKQPTPLAPTATSTVVTGLKAGSAYTFAISAFDTSGNESTATQTSEVTLPDEEAVSKCDMDGNGTINKFDVEILYPLAVYPGTRSTSASFRPEGDVDNNNWISVKDWLMCGVKAINGG